MPEATCTIRVCGRVQGVFFRGSTVEEARNLRLAGTVRNLPDGCVEVVATGPRECLERLIDWCRRGPPSARVEAVDVRWHAQLIGFSSFTTVR
jgi:acylphosphatase